MNVKSAFEKYEQLIAAMDNKLAQYEKLGTVEEIAEKLGNPITPPHKEPSPIVEEIEDEVPEISSGVIKRVLTSSQKKHKSSLAKSFIQESWFGNEFIPIMDEIANDMKKDIKTLAKAIKVLKDLVRTDKSYQAIHDYLITMDDKSYNSFYKEWIQ